MSSSLLFNNFFIKDNNVGIGNTNPEYKLDITGTLEVNNIYIEDDPNVMTIPSGIIIMWSGSTNNIPSGWILCNGQNNTPNLLDKFLIGTSASKQINSQGGANTKMIDVSNLPSHTHSGTTGLSGSHSHSGFTNNGTVDGAHTHTQPIGATDDLNLSSVNGQIPPADANGLKTNTYPLGANANSHSHAISSDGNHTHTLIMNPLTTTVTPVDITPIYYALSYIMKV
jgi:microcystin-dependent protein